MQLIYGDMGPQGNPSTFDNPKIQELPTLPSGTSAPNTVITSHAIGRLRLQTPLDGWFIQAPGAIGLFRTVLGTIGAAVAGVAWARSSLGTTFGDFLALDLIAILVGLPAVAAVGGWLLVGPAAVDDRPAGARLSQGRWAGPALANRG